MRNYMIGVRLADSLGLDLHPIVVKARSSPHFSETEAEVMAFNSRTTVAPKYTLVCWNDLRYVNGNDLLPDYASEFH
jgi:hypothetical protein